MAKKILNYPISGFPELLPREQMVFEDLVNGIKKIFRSHGFIPIETTAIERLNTLDKGGNENGIIFAALKRSAGELLTETPELGLRYDLTLPLARYVAQNIGHLNFPFKRYQFQRVWRGERAQAGRSNEFYHFDIDFVHHQTPSFHSEAEILYLMDKVLTELNIGPYTFKLGNNRLLKQQIMSLGVTEDLWSQIAKTSKKINTVGAAKTRQAVDRAASTAPKAMTEKIIDFYKQEFNEADGFEAWISQHPESESGEDILRLYRAMLDFGIPQERILIIPSLSRGLSYYTGNVYEIELVHQPNIGHICGGGRYDNLVNEFTGQKLPGLGISIGLTRLFERVLKKSLQDMPRSKPEIFFANRSRSYFEIMIKTAHKLRSAGITCDLFLEEEKIAKQLKYADQKGHTLFLIFNPDHQTLAFRNLKTGSQQEIQLKNLVEKIREEFPNK